MPGTELAAATRTARELGIPFVLCDRDVRVTLRRAWRALSLWKKSLLLSTFLAALFEKRELDEEELRELRQQDVLTRLVDELGRAFPAIKHVLIDERDAYLAEKMRCAPGRRIVAVVGAGHVRGLRDALAGARPRELAPLETVPPLSPVWKWLGWGVPALILGAIGAIAWRSGLAAAGDSLVAWALATGLPSLAGAIVAWSHPLTMLSALTTAPLTTLTPVIGVGHVAAFVQAWARPPFVHEFQSLADDVLSLPRWWSNRLLRVFLAFLLTTLGASIGTWLGGARLLAALLG
jgi:pheromone shutdown-related protein TraB